MANGYAPGWIAQCTSCGTETTLESRGWIRVGAYSYGKRTSLFCDRCERARSMKIFHVDEDGKPDQTLGRALLHVAGIHAIIWITVISVFAWIMLFRLLF